MYKTNIKKLFFTLIAVSFLVGNSSSLPVSEAKYVPVTRPICSLAVAPYNPSGTSLTNVNDGKYAFDTYLNILSADLCNNFVKLYDNPYSPQPPKSADNPVAPSAIKNNVSVPIIQHDHTYYNDTVADDYYYKEYVKKFVIILQPDTVKNIDLNNVKCDTFTPIGYDISKLAPLMNCSGSSQDDLWGGTTVTKTNVNDTVVVTWTFGNTNPKNLPRIWANNGTNFDYGTGTASVDFSDQENRRFGFSVHLPTNDNGDIWSATTTSKILLADQAIFRGPNDSTFNTYKDKPCVNNDVNNPQSGWCYLDPTKNGPTSTFPTEQVTTGAPHTFYWFNIGSVATVWKNTVKNVCTSLTATLDDKNPILINGNTAYPMQVNGITFSPKNTIPAGAELKWNSDDPNGSFWTDVTIYPDDPTLPGVTTQGKIGGNGVTTSTSSTKKVYFIGKAEAKITVTLDKIPADQISAQCNAVMQTPAVPECSEILVDHQKTIYENTYSIFKAKGLGTDSKDMKAKITYWVDPGYGEFYLVPPTGIAQNTSPMVYEATPTDQIIPFTKTTFTTDYKFDPKILIYGNTSDQAATSFIDISAKIATGKFGVQNISGNIKDPVKLGLAIQIKAIELPKWVTYPIPLNVNPVDPFFNKASDQTYESNPGKFGLNSTFNIDQTKPIAEQAINSTVIVQPPAPQKENPFIAVAERPTTPQFENPFANPGTQNVDSRQTTNPPAPQKENPFFNSGTQNIDSRQTTNPKTPQFENPFVDRTSQTPIIIQSFPNNGFFFDAMFNSITVDPNTPVYFYAKKPGKGVIHVKVIGSTDPNCGKTYDITPQPQLACKELGFITSTKGDLFAGQAGLINVNPKDTANAKLPPTTKLKITAKADVKVQSFATKKDLGTTALLSDFPISVTNATAGSISISIDPTDPAYAAICAASVNVLTPVGICTDLTPTLVDAAAKTNATQLEKNKNYIVSATLTTTTKDAYKITYTIDQKYGSFLDMSDLLNPKKIQQVTLGQINESPLILQTTATPPATPTGSIADVLKIQAAGFADTSKCTKSFPFNNPVVPLPLVCNSIIVAPTDTFLPMAVDPVTFDLTGDFKNHQGTIEINITSQTGSNEKPTVGRIDGTQTSNGNDGKPHIIFTADEVKNSNNHLQFKYTRQSFGDYVPPNPNTLDIKIDAIGSDNAACHKDVPGTGPIHTNPVCEGPNCNPCVGSQCNPPGPDTIPPTFQKFAYPDNNIKKAATTININKNTDHVTYMLIMKAGNNIKDASIIDSALVERQIKSKNENTHGLLRFRDMQVEVIKGSSKKILYSTPNYIHNDNDAGTFSQFSDSNFTATTENNLCSNAKRDKTLPCLDMSSTDAIPGTFSYGEALKFNQLSTLSQNDYIIVKYEMDYPRAYRISDGECRTLKAKGGGCGQEFDNFAHFVANKRNGMSPYKMDSSTKAIAICPYVLARQGGDVFFHDLVQTGVDVNQCYEVKSCEGPCITPETPGEYTTTSSGPGGKPQELKLVAPSHDVCSASNSGSNLAGYNDVLKNFSSSICEIKADISKAWTKQNITDSINANVKRLSRFDNNLNGGNSTLHSIADLPKNNAQSGVFIKTDGDLTIENIGLSNGYTIESPIDGSIPAAQTYIVIGHDLHINSDIYYSKLGINSYFTSQGKTNIPSAAFIVIDGNIIIDSNVKHLDGIFMAVDTDNIDTDGKNINAEGADGQIRAQVKLGDEANIENNSLNINGNLIGNVLNLFQNRQYAGDPLQDDGSVNIHYDESILLNPPPGIGELINLQQVVVPN